jgi:hypothetical protein
LYVPVYCFWLPAQCISACHIKFPHSQFIRYDDGDHECLTTDELSPLLAQEGAGQAAESPTQPRNLFFQDCYHVQVAAIYNAFTQ